MPFGTPSNSNSGGENLTHVAGVRMRITGSGELEMTLHSYDDEESEVLIPFTMVATTKKEPTRLANFIQQRFSLECATDLINEHFRINRIIFFVKEIWTSYPGTE